MRRVRDRFGRGRSVRESGCQEREREREMLFQERDRLRRRGRFGREVASIYIEREAVSRDAASREESAKIVRKIEGRKSLLREGTPCSRKRRIGWTIILNISSRIGSGSSGGEWRLTVLIDGLSNPATE